MSALGPRCFPLNVTQHLDAVQNPCWYCPTPPPLAIFPPVQPFTHKCWGRCCAQQRGSTWCVHILWGVPGLSYIFNFSFLSMPLGGSKRQLPGFLRPTQEPRMQFLVLAPGPVIWSEPVGGKSVSVFQRNNFFCLQKEYFVNIFLSIIFNALCSAAFYLKIKRMIT